MKDIEVLAIIVNYRNMYSKRATTINQDIVNNIIVYPHAVVRAKAQVARLKQIGITLDTIISRIEYEIKQ